MEIITNYTIECFKNHLLEEEKSASTVEKYIRDVRCFENRFHGRKAEKNDVLEYKRELCENYAPRSVNSILSSLNTFFAYINRHDLRVKTLKIQRQIFADEQRELSRGEYERLLSAAKRAKKERLYCLLQALGSTGLRISELSSVTVEAVKEKRRNHKLQRKNTAGVSVQTALPPAPVIRKKIRNKKRSGICNEKRQSPKPLKHLDGNEKTVPERQRFRKEGLSAQSAPPLCKNILQHRKRHRPPGRHSRSFKRQHNKDLHNGNRHRAPPPDTATR